VSDTDVHALIDQTQDLLARGRAHAHEMASLVGSWNWAMSVARSAMSAFHHVYGFARWLEARGTALGPARIWPSAQRELETACDLAPLLRVSLDPPVSDVVVATDASSVGFGVATAHTGASAREVAARTLSAHGLRLLAAARSAESTPGRAGAHGSLRAMARAAASPLPGGAPVQPAWKEAEVPCLIAAANGDDAPLPAGFRVMSQKPGSPLGGFARAYHAVTAGEQWAPVTWDVAVSGQWAAPEAGRGAAPEHINALELRTAGYGVAASLRVDGRFDSRFVLLTDSAVALGALTKGRSSSFALLRCVRRVSALLLATGTRPLYRFVESEVNPADLPSRELLARGSRFRWRAADAGGCSADHTGCAVGGYHSCEGTPAGDDGATARRQ
jgi:hypothetical protein